MAEIRQQLKERNNNINTQVVLSKLLIQLKRSAEIETVKNFSAPVFWVPHNEIPNHETGTFLHLLSSRKLLHGLDSKFPCPVSMARVALSGDLKQSKEIMDMT